MPAQLKRNGFRGKQFLLWQHQQDAYDIPEHPHLLHGEGIQLFFDVGLVLVGTGYFLADLVIGLEDGDVVRQGLEILVSLEKKLCLPVTNKAHMLQKEDRLFVAWVFTVTQVKKGLVFLQPIQSWEHLL